jgi:DnaJ-class molecular chaperone
MGPASAEEDHYAVLELHQHASEREITKAFRRLAFTWHPDKNPGREEECNNRFNEVNRLFASLLVSPTLLF